MPTELHFTDDELAQLHLLVAQDTEKTRVELHHTSGFPYREYLKRRLAQRRALLEKMNHALPELVVADPNA
jgi:hypothetical protein